MNRLKFMGAPVDERAHLEAYAEEGAYRVASELGCNWAYLTYNWGFPPEIEKEDWIVFQQASQIYHQHGIRVFAYIGVTQLAVSSFPCHHDSRSNPTPARGGQANESTQVG
jgi:hypothetical protein